MIAHKHVFVLKRTCRYQLAMLLNEINISDMSLGQLKIVTTNVQIMTSLGLKRIVKSCLVKNYWYYCAIPNCYSVNFTSPEFFLIIVMFVIYNNINYRYMYYIYFLFIIYFNEIFSHHCLFQFITLICNILIMYIYIHIVP